MCSTHPPRCYIRSDREIDTTIDTSSLFETTICERFDPQRAYQGDADELASRRGVDQDYDGFSGDETGFSTDGSVKSASGSTCRARRGGKASAPRRARSVARGGTRTGERRRRDEASNALVRVAGLERKRPYNNFHRFRRVSERGHNFYSTGWTKLFRASVAFLRACRCDRPL